MESQFKGKLNFSHSSKFNEISVVHQTRFHVASLTDGKIHPVTYESDPFFASHHINAFEENGHIVVDVAAYDRGDVSSKLSFFSEHLQTDLHFY